MKLADESKLVQLSCGGPGSGRRSGMSFPQDHKFNVGDKVRFDHPQHGPMVGRVQAPNKPTLSVGFRAPAVVPGPSWKWGPLKQNPSGYQSIDVHHTKVFQP